MSNDKLVWRPLLNGEYPPPGPTKYGPLRKDGTRPILVFAPPIRDAPVTSGQSGGQA